MGAVAEVASWRSGAAESVRARLWPIPTISVVLALVLGVVVPEIDEAVDASLSASVQAWIFGGDADAARSLLDAIASSLITVTALTFSLTVVTLQLASSQFSPRLLRTFTSDLFVQTTLALFLGTFIYALTVLRAVRSAGEEDEAEFVPRLAVTLAFALAVASVLGLVFFLAHLARKIRVETMLHDVHCDAVQVVCRELDERGSAAEERPVAPYPPPDAHRLVAPDDGFLVRVSEQDLLGVAAEAGVVVRLDPHPGAFLVRGTPLGTMWPSGEEHLDDETVGRTAERVQGCVRLGRERVSTQDVGFGLRQLVDVATKALSPGINDPTTAVHALGHVSSLLCELADRELGDRVLRDDDGRTRVVLGRPDLADYLDLGLSQPRRYGAADPAVLRRIVEVLLDLAHRVAPDQRPAVRHQLALLRTTVEEQSFAEAEHESLAALGARVETALGAGR